MDAMIEFAFRNSLGRSQLLKALPGEFVWEVLERHHVPPASVLVVRDHVPVPDSHRLKAESLYLASLIEGYDIDAVRRLYDVEEAPPDAVYLKRRLSFDVGGRLHLEQAPLTMDGVVQLVDDTLHETVSRYGLIRPGSQVIVGLSGGVDSSALLVALASLRARRADFDILAATFEDYDASRSGTFDHAQRLARQYDVAHTVLPANLAQKTFRMTLPLSGVLLSLMETEDAHHTMYVDHHVTRRTLEVFGEREGGGAIALGLHATDLLAGLLNARAVGYSVDTLPKRTLPNAEYVFPLAFVHKRELHLYYLAKTGRVADHTPPNQWELDPQDRNYYYFLADRLQSSWPGLEVWFFSGHRHERAGQPHLTYAVCANCGGAVQKQGLSWRTGQVCDVCELLERHHLIDPQLSAVGVPPQENV